MFPQKQPPPGNQPGKRGRSPSPPNQHQAYYKSAASYAQQSKPGWWPLSPNTVNAATGGHMQSTHRNSITV